MSFCRFGNSRTDQNRNTILPVLLNIRYLMFWADYSYRKGNLHIHAHIQRDFAIPLVWLLSYYETEQLVFTKVCFPTHKTFRLIIKHLAINIRYGHILRESDTY